MTRGKVISQQDMATPMTSAQAEQMIRTFDNEAPHHREARLAWWREARFGLFVHWGLFSAAGGTWKGEPCPFLGCWMQDRFRIPLAEYAAALLPKFTGERFDPEAIVKLALQAGMKYVIPVAKHHEGFSLFHSQASDFTIAQTPARQDWIRGLADACHGQGLRFGVYYSQNLDWHHPGGGGIRWDPAQDGDSDRYVDEIVIPQVRELLTGYGEVSVLWWDIPGGEVPGGIIDAARAARILAVVRELRPNIVMNNRLGGGFAGDTETPEQFIPPTGFPGRDWETCQTLNRTWEYTHYDREWKSPTTLIRELIDTASKGGNYLLNIGPKPDGSLPRSTVDTLRAMGGWMQVHGEAIHGTCASPFATILPWGRCTQRQLPDGVTRLYLHLFAWPFDSILRLPTLTNTVLGAALLSEPGAGPLPILRQADGRLEVQLPIAEPDDYATVVMVDVVGRVT